MIVGLNIRVFGSMVPKGWAWAGVMDGARLESWKNDGICLIFENDLNYQGLITT
jgi:hypothetical protein